MLLSARVFFLISLAYALRVTASPVVLSFPRPPHDRRDEAAAIAPKVSTFDPSSPTSTTHGWNLAADPEATRGSASVVSLAPVDTASLVLFSAAPSATTSPAASADGPSASSRRVASANAVAAASVSSSAAAAPASAAPTSHAHRTTSSLALIAFIILVSAMHSSLA